MDIQLSDFDAFSQDLRWLSGNLEKLQPKYENKFVLVKNKNVIAADSDYDRLLDEAVKMKIDLSKAVIEYIMPKDIQLVF